MQHIIAFLAFSLLNIEYCHCLGNTWEKYEIIKLILCYWTILVSVNGSNLYQGSMENCEHLQLKKTLLFHSNCPPFSLFLRLHVSRVTD